MAEIQLNGREFRTLGPLDTFSQLHIARKLAPALPLVEGLVNPGNENKDKSVLTVLMFSQVTDADAEYIMGKCLAVIGFQQEPGKPPVRIHVGGKLMFQDIEMADILALTVAVIEENLGDFFRTALTNMVAPATPASA
jgi:hypothetical protein